MTSWLGKAVAVTAWLAAGCAGAADVTVFAPNAVKAPLVAIAAQYEQASVERIVFTWSGSESITKRVGEGEVFDVIVSTRSGIDQLAAQGKLVATSRVDFVRSAIGVAVRSGMPHPAIATVDELRLALLSAGSIAISSGPSGRYMVDLFQQLGIADQVRHKLKQPPSGAQIGELLAAGEADIGFQQVSELQHVQGIDFLGPLPASIQNYTIYAAGRHVAAPHPEAARAFMNSLVAPGAADQIRKGGLEPM